MLSAQRQVSTRPSTDRHTRNKGGHPYGAESKGGVFTASDQHKQDMVRRFLPFPRRFNQVWNKQLGEHSVSGGSERLGGRYFLD